MQIPFGLFDFIGMMFILPIIIFIIMVILIIKFACGATKAVGSFVTTMPTFATPSTATRSDGADIRTVRLPSTCPSCGAALSPEGIDWVGPMEARCSYCGSTVRARLERL